MNHQKLAYTIKEVSQLTGLGKDSLYRARREGHLKWKRFGKRVMYLHPDVIDFIASLPAGDTPRAPNKSAA
jgi:excisionase family DNA binding protein